MNALQLELCAASLEALELAYKHQFDRVELCQNLEQGGLTPSAGLIQMAKDFNLNTHVLIRPRAGGFCYNEEELALMQKEIAFLFEPGISIKIEQEIISDKGEFSRPDRVVEKDGELFIIDFKTGEESEKHRKQLEKYEVLLFQIHGKKAKSYLLYIEKNKIIEL